MTTPRNRRQRFEAFLSLEWYEVTLRFIATFVAKTSELLLAAGLVVSSANFLTDGNVLKAATASQAWAWAQALAIDSSLAISFYYVLQCLKQRDWIKLVLYSLLTLLLALVAGTITNIDIYSHAIHSTIQQATGQLGIDIQMLSTLRAIAVVGFVLMSRLRDVSFKDLYAAKELDMKAEESATGLASVSSTEREANSRFSIEEVAALLHVVVQEKTLLTQNTSPRLRGEESTNLLSSPESGATENVSSSALSVRQETEKEQPSALPLQEGQSMHPTKRQEKLTDSPTLDDLSSEQHMRLEQAYVELQTQGKRLSGRALAQLAHIHRSTCNTWLEARREENSHSGQGSPEQQKSIEEEISRKDDNVDA